MTVTDDNRGYYKLPTERTKGSKILNLVSKPFWSPLFQYSVAAWQIISKMRGLE